MSTSWRIFVTILAVVGAITAVHVPVAGASGTCTTGLATCTLTLTTDSTRAATESGSTGLSMSVGTNLLFTCKQSSISAPSSTGTSLPSSTPVAATSWKMTGTTGSTVITMGACGTITVAAQILSNCITYTSNGTVGPTGAGTMTVSCPISYTASGTIAALIGVSGVATLTASYHATVDGSPNPGKSQNNKSPTIS